MLQPGSVIRVPVAFKQGRPKYLVIVDLDTEAHCLVINTKIHPLFGREPFRASYVAITVATHPFMDHDSHIDCNEIKRLSLIQIRTEINADANCHKGYISDDLRTAIIAAMQATPCLTDNEIERYVGALA